LIYTKRPSDGCMIIEHEKTEVQELEEVAEEEEEEE
jgi:hypothetical protein